MPGAALATLQASVRRPDALYTFGSPRVGDSQFMSRLSGVPGRRYVDCCDIVTRLPPENCFVHVGEPYYIKLDRSIEFRPDLKNVTDDQNAAREDYLIRYCLEDRKRGSA